MQKTLEARGNFYDVFISEGGYFVKNLNSYAELNAAFLLRHKIFCEELSWVPSNDNLMEIDEFDNNCISFGVFDKNKKLTAYLRLIITINPFMLEHIFSDLIGPMHLLKKKRDTAEITRLCISPEARKNKIMGNFGVNNISMFLYKGVFHWCKKNKIRFLYLVVEDKILRLLNAKGFPCNPIGEPKRMPDGVDAVAALMDWEEFRNNNIVKRPKLIEWFTEFQSSQAPGQLPLHDTGLLRQVSA